MLSRVGRIVLVPTVYPGINQWSVSVISFRRVFVGSGSTEQEDRRRESSEVREETAAASSSASE